MTRYTEDWLDGKLRNLARWKAEEAERSAQSKRGRSLDGACHQEPGTLPRSTPAPIKAEAPAATAVPPVFPPQGRVASAPIKTTAAHADAAAIVPGAGRASGGHVYPAPGADAAMGGHPSKYRNERSGAYASKREAKRASQLKLMLEANTIRNLREQVEYLLIPRQKRPDGTVAERACSYVADFVYEEFRDGEWQAVTEDVKGMRTDVYRLKRKLMLFVHGVEIRET